jgi:hypothetical protein
MLVPNVVHGPHKEEGMQKYTKAHQHVTQGEFQPNGKANQDQKEDEPAPQYLYGQL